MTDDFPTPTVFVKGGTTSTDDDRAHAEQLADAKRRREVQDAQRRIALDRNARLQTLALGGRRYPMIVLAVRHPQHGGIDTWITCELSVQGGGEIVASGAASDLSLMLLVACPRCARSPHRREGENYQLSIRSEAWPLTFEKKLPKWMGHQPDWLWVDPIDGDVYQVAGTVHLPAKVRCSNRGCDFRFEIDDSLLVPC